MSQHKTSYRTYTHSNLLDPFETVIEDDVPGRIEVAWPQAGW